MRLTNIAMYATPSTQYSYISEEPIVATEPINFNLGDRVPPSKFQVRSMVGLDAEEINPRFYGFGVQSGSRFYDFGLKSRDIAMRVVLRPDHSIGESNSDIRDMLYRAISANRSGFVVLHFNAGATNVAKIKGQIIKFEAALFNKETEIQITIRCDDPMFRSITPVVVKPEDVLDTARISYPNVNISDTLSTSPHGFSADFVFSGPSPTFTIKDREGSDYDWQFRVVPFQSFIAGDILHFSSEYGNKQLVRERGGGFLSLIDTIQSSSVWPIIFPGENKFFFGEANVIDWTTIKYFASYWGV